MQTIGIHGHDEFSDGFPGSATVDLMIIPSNRRDDLECGRDETGAKAPAGMEVGSLPRSRAGPIRPGCIRLADWWNGGTIRCSTACPREASACRQAEQGPGIGRGSRRHIREGVQDKVAA